MKNFLQRLRFLFCGAPLPMPPKQFIVKLRWVDGQRDNYFAYGSFEKHLERARLVHKIDFGGGDCILVFEEHPTIPS